jgi:hypothetical protein
MLTKQNHHEMPIQVEVPSPNSTEAPTVCTAYVVFKERVPERVYGFYMVPPGQEWVGLAVKEWYGFDVKLGPWKQIENLSINRLIWEAAVLERVRL